MTSGSQSRSQSPALAGLRVAAAGSLALYLGWNAYWLSRAQIPPSLFQSITGLPCPTTGGTRSARKLLQGDVAGSLRLNPMTVPISILFVASAGWPLVMILRRRRPSLPMWVCWCWVVVLTTAWACKLLGDPQYW